MSLQSCFVISVFQLCLSMNASFTHLSSYLFSGQQLAQTPQTINYPILIYFGWQHELTQQSLVIYLVKK